MNKMARAFGWFFFGLGILTVLISLIITFYITFHLGGTARLAVVRVIYPLFSVLFGMFILGLGMIIHLLAEMVENTTTPSLPVRKTIPKAVTLKKTVK